MEIIFQPTRENDIKFIPVSAKKTIPEWYKNTPNTISGESARALIENNNNTPYSIKKCMPVLDFMSSGYVLFNQSDFILSSDDANSGLWWKTCAEPEFNHVDYHPHVQCPVEINKSKKSYFKVKCGYIIKTPPGYSCLFYQSPYFFESRFTIFPGIIDTDRFDDEIEFTGYINKHKDNIMVEAGAPIVWVFPFKREKWDSKIDKNIFDFSFSIFKKKKRTFLYDAYKNFFHQKKSFN